MLAKDNQMLTSQFPKVNTGILLYKIRKQDPTVSQEPSNLVLGLFLEVRQWFVWSL